MRVGRTSREAVDKAIMQKEVYQGDTLITWPDKTRDDDSRAWTPQSFNTRMNTRYCSKKKLQKNWAWTGSEMNLTNEIFFKKN